MNKLRWLLLCLILTISRAGLSQQSPAPSGAFQLFFSAIAKKGSHVQLAPGDVEVLDNSDPQTLLSLKPAEDLPLALGLLQDGSSRNLRYPQAVPSVAEEKSTISSFLGTWIREQDRSVWVEFAGESPNLGTVDLLDRAGMQEVVNAGTSQRAGTELLQAVEMYRGQLPGTACRRAVIVVANGGTFLGPDMYKRVEEIALREKIVLHVIDTYPGRTPYGPRGLADYRLPRTNLPSQISGLADSIKQTLSDLAADTGGLYIQAIGKDAMKNALSRLQEQLGNQYVITCSGPRTQPPRDFHSLRIKAAKGAFSIHAPKGYYISPD